MKKILTCLIVLAVLCGVLYVCINVSNSDTYEDSGEFTEFADRALKERELFRKNENTTVDYRYSESFSIAVRTDTDSGEAISRFRDERINDAEKEYLFEAIVDDEENVSYACIIDTAVKRSGTGALSLVIYQKLYEDTEKGMSLKDSSIKTYFFSDETGEKIEPLQAFTLNYKDDVSRFAEDYFSKSFDKSKLTNGWQKYIVADEKNFNNFIMTGESVIFFFQPGQVLGESYGVVPLKIPQQYLRSSIRPKVLNRLIDPKKPMVAITYDDGPGGKSETRILDCLEKYDCVATFFYLGSRMEKYGYNAVRALEIGCEIGNHSWNHPPLTTLSKKRIGYQLDKTSKAIEEKTGLRPELMRPPYGDNDKKVDSVIKSKDMAEVLWTIDTRDWESRNSKMIYKSVVKKKKLDGKIILMHSIYNETARATEKIVPWLKKNGYQTVTVSELIQYKTGKKPEAGKIYRKIH